MAIITLDVHFDMQSPCSGLYLARSNSIRVAAVMGHWGTHVPQVTSVSGQEAEIFTPPPQNVCNFSVT